MRKLHNYLQNVVINENHIPLILFGVCAVGFGLLIPNLGFYMDDWPYVFYAYHNGLASLKEMLFYDSRPGAAWLYMLGFWTLGFKPLHWHIAMLVFRWLSVVFIWAFLRNIWPTRIREVTQIALLFSIFPFYMLQPSPVGYAHLWTGLFMYGMSVWLMVHAYLNRKYWIPATGFALLLAATHMFTSEYFVGLELLRPLILWILISRQEKSPKRTIQLVLLRWLPYLIILFIYMYWRIYIFEYPPGVTRNTPVVFNELFLEPFKALWFLFKTSVKDAASIMSEGWQMVFDAKLMSFDSVFGRYRIIISLSAFFLIYFFLNKLFLHDPDEKIRDDWHKYSFLVALAALLLGGLPIWLIGKSFFESPNLISASRFGLPSMLGASFLFILMLYYFIDDLKKRNLILALLVAFAINFHLDNAKNFQYSWEKQKRLYQEMIWRAPGIEPGTAIVTDQEILGYMGQYATSFAIMTVYEHGKITSPPYWYFPVSYTYPNLDHFVSGESMDGNKLSMQFHGQSSDSLILAFDPELDRCLWILRPQDTDLSLLLSTDMQRLSTISAVDRITENNPVKQNLPEVIFGKPSTKGWCYYFEKADLARQKQKWNDIVELYNQANEGKFQPGNGFEYIPFIEGYAHLGDWENAFQLTKTANRISKGMYHILCPTWQQLAENTPFNSQKDASLRNAYDLLRCIP